MTRTAPAVIFAAAGGLAAAWLCAVILISVNQPWLGLTLEARDGAVHVAGVDPDGPSAMLTPGEILTGIGDAAGTSLALRAGDIIDEPDGTPTYAELDAFLARQSAISSFLRQGPVRLWVLSAQGGGYETVAEPRPARPPASLPAMFWIGLLVSGTGFMIGAWVWSLRPRAPEARLFALSGLGLLMTTPTYFLYGVRELALDGRLFRIFMTVNFAGALTFGASLAALFLVYPQRLVPRRVLAALPALCILFWLGDAMRFGFPGPALGRHVPLAALTVAMLSAAAIQYVRTRGDPRMRASVLLFGLSVAAGTGLFVLMVILPALIGAEIDQQTPLIIPFLLIYAGAAVAIARYRLFALGPWAFQILFYMGGVFVLVLLDALLVFGLALDRAPALGIALIVTAFVYLPLRDVLAQRLLRRRETDTEALLQDVTDVALAPSGADRDALWQEVLRRAFAPLHLTPLQKAVGAPQIVDDGLALHLPGTRDVAAVALSHARGGRRLFSPRDLALANQLCTVLRHITESRLAYDEGANAERQRIARDMHDNIGAQLLSALHSSAPERKDAMVREALSDLRLFINNAGTGGQPLAQTLAGLRLEATERLSAAGIRLDWSAPETPAPVMLAPGVIHAVRSILREAVSNTIRHSGAGAMRIAIACEGDRLRVSVCDDGRGLPREDFAEGNGFGNIRTRLAGLDGSLEIGDAAPGLRLDIEFPLTPRIPA